MGFMLSLLRSVIPRIAFQINLGRPLRPSFPKFVRISQGTVRPASPCPQISAIWRYVDWCLPRVATGVPRTALILRLDMDLRFCMIAPSDPLSVPWEGCSCDASALQTWYNDATNIVDASPLHRSR